jgi:nudix-type nucleoside diphosphatase (YffH/AdpP family)
LVPQKNKEDVDARQKAGHDEMREALDCVVADASRNEGAHFSRNPQRNPMTVSDRIRVKDVRVLSNHYCVLDTTTFDWRRGDGEWQTQHRETYHRGNAAALLPYHPVLRTVVLVRQFRYPAYVSGHDDLLIEAAAGLLDNAAPEARIRAEVEEETGYRLGAIKKVFEAFMSPGAITEKMHFFVAEYASNMKVGSGGGLASEGEDIEVLELPIDQAMAMISDGRIADAKTIMLLQYAALHIFR